MGLDREKNLTRKRFSHGQLERHLGLASFYISLSVGEEIND